MTQQTVNLSEVAKITGVSRRTINRLVEEGEFPEPVRVIPRKVKPLRYWRIEDIQVWMGAESAVP